MKKLILLTLACVLASVLTTTAQTRSAEYPGGSKALDTYIYSNLRTYNLKRKLGRRFPTATVVMDYSVNQEGRVVRLKKISSPHSGFTDEVARVFRRMPRWKPAMRNGQPYLTKHRYTVKFDLTDKRSSTSSRSSSTSRSRYTSHTNTNTRSNGITRDAQFPGGKAALDKYVKDHLVYPEWDPKIVWPVDVKIRFTVKADGSVTHTHILRTTDIDYTIMAERIIYHLPKWQPAMRNGKAVESTQIYTVHYPANAKNPNEEYYKGKSESYSQSNESFRLVQVMPYYPGENRVMTQDIFELMKKYYPAEAKRKGIEGNVAIKYIVEKDGSIRHVNVLSSANPLLNAAAVKIMTSLPKHAPGLQRGHKVRVETTRIIPFRLKPVEVDYSSHYRHKKVR